MSLKEQLQWEADSFRLLGNNGAWIYPEFILRNGREYAGRPLPKRFKLGTPKACFWNAQDIVRRSRGRYHYVEGYAYRFIPMHHGWVVDDENLVIEPTLRDGLDGSPLEETQYYGVRLTYAQLTALRPRGGGPLFSSDWGYKIKNMIAIDPTVETIFNEYRTNQSAHAGGNPV